MNELSMEGIKLETMTDDQIKSLITQGYKLLDRRKRDHEKKIKSQIRQMANKAGIKVSFTDRPRRKRGDSES